MEERGGRIIEIWGRHEKKHKKFIPKMQEHIINL